MRKRITLCEFNYYPHMLPLVSGYLWTYACRDPEIASNASFELYTRTANTPPEQIIEDLAARQSDVYAISCYIWNMGLVKRLLGPLSERVPHAYIILGGPQVQNRAQAYVRPDQERIFIANGEGEVIFYEFLKEVIAGSGKFRSRPGLNFWQHGMVMTTPSPPLIQELDEIPSPFLSGIYDGIPFVNVAYETNRGCPYTCSFCYFSRGGEYRKLRKFSRDRVKAELDWLTSKDLMYLFMADANWGVFKEDIDISRQLADYAKERGSPTFISFSSAKNRPNSVFEIAKIFKDAGITNAQPISFQSLNPEVLKLISRTNIKPDKIDELQGLMHKERIDSYVEMIWPLPGETLDSFKDGLEKICVQQLGTITCYPTILLPNTALWNQVEEFGFKTIEPDAELSDSKIVVQTKWVTNAEYKDGVRFFFALHILFNLGTLRCLAAYLHDARGIRRRDLFTAFADYMRTHQENELAFWVEDFAIEKGGFFDNGSLGLCAHRVLHEDRGSFQQFLHQFVTAQEWWADPVARLFFEADMLNTPFLYSSPPRGDRSFYAPGLKYLKVEEVEQKRCVVRVSPGQRAMIERYIEIDAPDPAGGDGGLYEIIYVQNQIPFMPTWTTEQIGNHGQGRVQSNRSLMPRWAALKTADELVVEEVL